MTPAIIVLIAAGAALFWGLLAWASDADHQQRQREAQDLAAHLRARQQKEAERCASESR